MGQPQRGLGARLHRRARSPFVVRRTDRGALSPEAELSGVGRQLQPDEWLWYRRSFSAPSTTGRVLLHFGAVDQICTVWVNGAEAGSHTGGYLPFTLDVTEHDWESAVIGRRGPRGARPRPLRDRGARPRQAASGQQGDLVHRTVGIWQTVWLEAVPASYVERLVLTPHLESGELEVTVVAAGVPVTTPAHVVVGVDEADVPARGAGADPALRRTPLVARAPAPVRRRGDPRRRPDHVVRRPPLVRHRHGRARPPTPLLNGEPVTHVGVLDQGYWPDGLLTPPSDEAMVHDIEAMKSLGFNMLRKHAKIEPLRWYAHCDRLGMLVWQDVVNGGGATARSPPSVRRGSRCGSPTACTGSTTAATPPAAGVPARGARDRRAAAQRGVPGGLDALQRGLGTVRRQRHRPPDRRPRPDQAGQPHQRLGRPGRR